MPDSANHRRRGWKGRHCETNARSGLRSVRDCIAFRGDAFRVVYAVQLSEDVWIVHAFQKKSTRGTKTPKHEVDLIKYRLKSLREMLR